MRSILLTSLVALAVSARQRPYFEAHGIQRPRDINSTGEGTPGTFDQLIDHSNPSLGTFKQRFWWNDDYYGGPGSPIVLGAPGESQVDPDYIDLSNVTLSGLFAQTNNGANIILEHRYWGNSSPVGFNFTPESLQHLTLDNAIQDLIYFANNVKLPFDRCGKSKPSQAPWILTGCSYSGALSAWTHALAPGTFWAHQCGSAVVEAVTDFWQFFTPIEQAMPRNCSADWKRIVSHIDTVLDTGTDQQKQDLKASLYYPNTTDSEFAEDMTDWLGSWQGHQLYSPYGRFFTTCDQIENQWPGSNVSAPGAEGVGLELAIKGFAYHRQQQILAAAAKANQTDDDPVNPWDDADDNLWNWFLCNEPFEWWQDWGPGENNGMTPKAFSIPEARKEYCADVFPNTNGFKYGLKTGRTVDQVNAKTGGWLNVNTTRLVWMNGEFDPWRSATVSWPGRPGGALKSTKEAPAYVIPGAAHCNDHWTKNALVNEAAGEIFAKVVQQMQDWVGEFYAEKGKKQPTGRKHRRKHD